MATATRVLNELRQEGLVRAVPGVGTVVQGRGAAPSPAAVRPRRRATSAEALTPERIVDAAVAVADAEGLAAVSMRRVAGEIGAATMALYRHVADKEDLVVRMMNAVMEAWRPPAEPPAGWRPGVELAARVYWAGCREHPWMASALSITRPQPLAGALPFSEFLLATLDGLGLDHQTTFTAYLMLVNYVRGMALNLELEAEAEAATGVDNEEWMEAQEPQLAALVGAGEFPVFTRYVTREYDFDLDRLFDFGLQRMLDGLAALVAEKI
jgi:AcrR family transcriptional regulator